MNRSVAEVAQHLEARGLLRRQGKDHAARTIAYVRGLIGRDLPQDLETFYRERLHEVGGFRSVTPVWNERVGWRTEDTLITALLHVQAVPIFEDGCGNLFGLDLSPGDAVPAVYFFDHEVGFEKPEWAAGSSLGSFLLLLADHERAYEEKWPADWQLAIDPDIDNCPRAPALSWE